MINMKGFFAKIGGLKGLLFLCQKGAKLSISTKMESGDQIYLVYHIPNVRYTFHVIKFVQIYIKMYFGGVLDLFWRVR